MTRPMDNPKNILCIAFPLDEPEEQAVVFFCRNKGLGECLILRIERVLYAINHHIHVESGQCRVFCSADYEFAFSFE